MAYVALPEYRPGGQIDFGPVNQAFAAISQQNNVDRQFGMQQKQIDAQNAERSYQHGRDAKQDSRQSVLEYGKAAMAVDQMDGPQRAAAWQATLARHNQEFPGQPLTPEEMDPVTGPKLMAAQAGQWVDPLERKAKLLGIQKDEAEIKALGQKNSLNDAIAGLITGGPGSAEPAGAPAGGPAPTMGPQNRALPPMPAPQVQPQSYSTQPTMPGIILAADTQAVPQPAPQQQPAAQPDIVQTPLGPMTRQQAQRAGMGLSLAGKDGAGKAMLDAAGVNNLEKTASNENDKQELGATGQLATLNSIKSSYDAKFLNIPNRFRLWGASLMDKFGTLNPQDKADLTAYTQFRQNAWHNLNRVLKDLSGTAVTENEMQRQLLDLPNPGKGIADGDSPTEFDAKLKNSIAFQTSAIARARYLRNKGFTGKPWEAGLAVEDMPALINQRGAEIEQQLRQSNPNVDPMQLRQATTRAIKQEFGI